MGTSVRGHGPSVAAWHAAPAGEVLARLESGPEGPTAVEADRRLAEHGPNALTRHRGPTAWQVLIRQFTSPLVYALLASAAVAFALGDVPDGAVVLAVVVLNALIGFAQEYRAGKAIQALAQLVSEPATVRRDGRWTQIGAEDLVPGDVVSLEHDLRLLGLVGLIDPPRDEVVEAIAGCHRAGIAVKMITGDHAATAAAIGRELGIAGQEPPMTGTEIAASSDEELQRRVPVTHVFARVAPEHKLRLVRALQSGGAVTAMTGDGVNDAPACGRPTSASPWAGTAAAKEAADIVLGDDNFATIRAAIEEGRRVYDNLVKALAFALPTNVGEALIVLVAVLAFPVVGGQPILPIEPVQILWINLVATVSLALPLAFEAHEPGLMRRPPRDPDELLLSRFVVARTVYVGMLMAAIAVVLFLIAVPSGAEAGSPELAQAQTLAVTSVAFFQIFYLLVCRTLTAPVRSIGWTSNPYVFGGIGVLLVLQAGFVHLPVMHALFRTADLTATGWLLAAAAGAVVVPVVSAEKAWRRRSSTPSPVRP